MKLSIIVPSYNQKNELKSLLDSCLLQKYDDYEVLITVNTPSTDEMNLLEQYKNIFENRLKVIFNTRRQSVVKNIFKMLHLATGQYFIVVYPETNLKDVFVQKFLEYEKEYTPDILEFKPKFKGFFKLEPRKRIEEKQLFNIQEDKKVVAFTFPTIFNKFYNRKKFIEIIKNKTFKDANTKYLIDIVYKTILYFQTYVYIDEVIVNEWNNDISINNPTQIIRDWKNIEIFTKENKPDFLEEIAYAKLFHLQVFVPTILGVTKKSLLKRLLRHQEQFSPLVLKYYDKLKIMRKEEFNLITSVNKYIFLNTDESKLVTNSLPPSKWNSLQGKF
ncbi:glycosyltransferase family 2 protein [Mesomycoplasma lagogenitalium]|uniref:Glycosyltransferase family 2 protein n=1 Tax=Mesomycoplasma lagogenitalium TaxID=171286 RepID=A0ABY8LX23_9BACT|nr:glycosyltransferase family 2 protein [Mesomycoplasma lagogenitalium]WGI36961.1 glycosyltransferase family 2 protein [Mesomycoplasma lagogenitalium]